MVMKDGGELQKVLNRASFALGVDGVLGEPGLNGGVVGVYDLGPNLGEFTISNTGTVDPGGTGPYTFATVPYGEMWRLFMVDVDRAGGTCTFDGLLLFDGSNAMNMIRQTAADELIYISEQGLLLPAPYQVRVSVAAYSGGSLTAKVFIQKFSQLTPATLPG